MNLYPVQESQWMPLQRSAYSIDPIKTKAKRIVVGLEHVTKDADDRGDPKMSITVFPDSDLTWNVETDLGNGRLSLRWQCDTKELFGVLVFERALFDHLDRRAWEAVLTVKVPAQGGWQIGDAETAFANTQHLDENNKLYVLAMSILYAVVNGPSVG